jgi:hypothetical protein
MSEMTRQTAEPTYAETISFGKVAPGTTWEGTYTDKRTVPTKAGRDAIVYTIETGDGPIDFWGVTAFERRMDRVPKGSYVWIEYRGKVPTKSGTPRHEVFVEFDPDNAVSESEVPL